MRIKLDENLSRYLKETLTGLGCIFRRCRPSIPAMSSTQHSILQYLPPAPGYWTRNPGTPPTTKHHLSKGRNRQVEVESSLHCAGYL